MKKRLYEVDMLRFIAAIAIVAYHFFFVGPKQGLTLHSFGELEFVTKYMFFGVPVFFMISGFVISMSCEHGSIKRFVRSRFLRLYPAYWLAASLTAIVTLYIGGGNFNVDWIKYLVNLTMLQNYFHVESLDGAYWTLFIEMQFYLFIGLLLVTGLLRYSDWFAAAAIVFTVVFFLQTEVPRVFPFANIFPHWMGWFASGIIFYSVYRHGFTRLKGLLLFFGYIGAVAQTKQFTFQMGGFYQTQYNLVVLLLLCTMAFVSFALVSMNKTKSVRKPNYAFWGELSYPIYLTHQMIGYMLLMMLGTQATRYLDVLLVSGIMIIVAALVMYAERILRAQVDKLIWSAPPQHLDKAFRYKS